MRIGELAQRAGTTTKAVRYYESLGLIVADRAGNGYREFDELHVRLVREIRALAAVGVRAEDTRPFLDCLAGGNERGDDCAASRGAYREALDDLEQRIHELDARRGALAALLADSGCRVDPLCELEPAGA